MFLSTPPAPSCIYQIMMGVDQTRPKTTPYALKRSSTVSLNSKRWVKDIFFSKRPWVIVTTVQAGKHEQPASV